MVKGKQKLVSVNNRKYLVIEDETTFVSRDGIHMKIVSFLNDTTFIAYELQDPIQMGLEMNISDIRKFINAETVDDTKKLDESLDEMDNIIDETEEEKEIDKLNAATEFARRKLAKVVKKKNNPISNEEVNDSNEPKTITEESNEQDFVDLYFNGKLPMVVTRTKGHITKYAMSGKADTMISYREEDPSELGNIYSSQIQDYQGNIINVVSMSIFYNDEVDYISFALCCRKLNTMFSKQRLVIPALKEANQTMISRIIEKELTSVEEVIIIS
jgi:hypothetical protein